MALLEGMAFTGTLGDIPANESYYAFFRKKIVGAKKFGARTPQRPLRRGDTAGT